MTPELRRQIDAGRTPLREVRLTTRETIRYGAIVLVTSKSIIFIARGGAWTETIPIDDVVRVERIQRSRPRRIARR